MKEAIYFHAGCPVCISAESTLVETLAATQPNLERVHLGEQPDRIAQAESLGVRSVPALVMGSEVLHINFGAALADLRRKDG